jgi:N6-adenosine-specific RNA methylase IME4
MDYEFHEAANIFPMMEGQGYKDLVSDIAANGLQMPIVLHEEKILDGRNRYRACLELGLLPEFVYYEGDNPFSYVVSLNLKRRHLDESQRAMVAAKLANMVQGTRTDIRSIDTMSQPKAAELLNVSVPSVKRAKQVIEHGTPEMIHAVEQGEVTVSKAVQEIRRAEAISNMEDIKTQEVKVLTGLYDVIVIDPPWDMKKIERDVAPNQVEFDYPTMTDTEINNLQIPSADNCHIWLWTTHKKLPFALELLKTWGLKYVCTFVWHKPGGFQPFGLPQYNCEFVLYARKGAPIFVETKQFNVCFNAPRGSHSEKPEEFYDVVRRVTSGRRLDMFNRRKIEGFDGWGKEAV